MAYSKREMICETSWNFFFNVSLFQNVLNGRVYTYYMTDSLAYSGVIKMNIKQMQFNELR